MLMKEMWFSSEDISASFPIPSVKYFTQTKMQWKLFLVRKCWIYWSTGSIQPQSKTLERRKLYNKPYHSEKRHNKGKVGYLFYLIY